MPTSITQGLEPSGTISGTPQLFGYAADSVSGNFGVVPTPQGALVIDYPYIGAGTIPTAKVQWADDIHGHIE